MAPRARRVTLATGIRVHLLEWNADRGLPHTVVLLHGFLDLAWSWEAVVEAGLGEVHVVAPDLRGHGDSDRVGAGGYYHFADYLADLHSLLREVATPRVSLIGHSMGGAIAAYYAGSFPERAERIAVLEGIAPPDSGGAGPERVAAWIAACDRVRAEAPRRFADVAEAAARLRKHDPRLGEALALALAGHGTRPAED